MISVNKAVSVILCVVIVLSSSCATPTHPLSASEFLDLGEKYLLELNYEQALVQFLKVIEIEPMNARAYIGAAEAYIGLGDTDSAIAILMMGLDALPGDAEIQAMLDELTKSAPPDNSEMYLAYYRTVRDNPTYTYLLHNADPVELRLTGGGLLDFNNDGLDELVLIYENDWYVQVYVIYSFANDQVFELFDILLNDGGNWGYRHVLELNGKGAIFEYYRSAPTGDGTGPMAMGGGVENYHIFEDGELVNKFGYQENSYVINTWDVSHRTWEISRDGEVVAAGTADPDVSISEIEAARVEAQETFGSAWTPMSIDELLLLLNPNTPAPSAESNAQEIYYEFMRSKEWRNDDWDLYWFAPDTEHEITSYKIFDFDGNGVYDLWIEMEDDTGFRPAGISAFYTIEDGQVKRLLDGSLSGGTMGGDWITTAYDSQTGEHLIGVTGYMGGFGGRNNWSRYYRYINGELSRAFSISEMSQVEINYSDDELADDTLFYVEDDSPFGSSDGRFITVYRVNDVQVTREVYEQMKARINSPIDERYILKSE
jgi:hypothetical protein